MSHTLSLRNFFEPSISRPPSPRERDALIHRLARLRAMEGSAAAATAKLQDLVGHGATSADRLRIRHQFVRLDAPSRTADTTTLAGTKRDQRPPATRILSPRGSALPFFLTLLLDAQMRLPAGHLAARNETPVKAENDRDGWTNYVATDAQVADKGQVFKTVRDKKARQIHSSLIRLASENLIHLPVKRDQRDYDGFTLLRDDARPRGDNDLYKVPDEEDEYFTVPMALFTSGWVHVLEDSEIVLLLITARMRHKYGDAPRPMDARARRLHFGLTKDSYEAAHRMLDYLSILDVISDWNRTSDGKVTRIRERGAQPHDLRFHPNMLERTAYSTIVDTITEQIARSKAP